MRGPDRGLTCKSTPRLEKMDTFAMRPFYPQGETIWNGRLSRLSRDGFTRRRRATENRFLCTLLSRFIFRRSDRHGFCHVPAADWAGLSPANAVSATERMLKFYLTLQWQIMYNY